MKRRDLIKNALQMGVLASPISILASTQTSKADKGLPVTTGSKKPITIYNNWSAYDELSDNIPLTEALAMKQLNELVRYKSSGVKIDYYVMDAFWFDKAGGYRTWHKERWPNGPDEWIKGCKENDILPGMWFAVNDRISDGSSFFLDMIPEWSGSECTVPKALCLFRGGYLQHLAGTLQMWADKGIRAFKFDFARFYAASQDTQQQYLQSEIEEMNKLAFTNMLTQFRQKNPGVLIIGYNGFGGDMSDTFTPFRKSVDTRWLQVFDTMYCGDPRFSDVPTSNIWRSADIYSDHMVRMYEMNGLPLQRIDNCGFMIGVAGTCYKRANNAWKGMQILEMARGGWVNVYHGNLELLTSADVQWFAKAQSLYTSLQQFGVNSTFGEIPGKRKPYGFLSVMNDGEVCTCVNPSQETVTMELPVNAAAKGSVIYADGGYKPTLNNAVLTLGAEQLAVVGFCAYADKKYSLGSDDTIRIPVTIQPIKAEFKQTAKNTISSVVNSTEGMDIRILVQQLGADNLPVRSSGGSPPDGRNLDTIIKIAVTQNGLAVATEIQYDKMIWSGLSWGAAEIRKASFNPDLTLDITCSSTEQQLLTLRAEVYAISY